MLLLSELWRFLRMRRKYWLLPLIFINLALGGLPAAAAQFSPRPPQL